MIKRIYSYRELIPYLRDIVKIYSECFSAEPWSFDINISEEIKMLKTSIKYPRNIFLLKFFEKRLIGATIAYPVEFQSEISEFIGPEKRGNTICLFKIFVDPEYQAKGNGIELHLRRLLLAKEEGFTSAVQWTSPRSKMYPIIKKGGFKVIGNKIIFHQRVTLSGVKTSPVFRVISEKDL